MLVLYVCVHREVSDSGSGWTVDPTTGQPANNPTVTALRSVFYFGAPRVKEASTNTLYETEGDDLIDQRLDLGVFLLDTYSVGGERVDGEWLVIRLARLCWSSHPLCVCLCSSVTFLCQSYIL